MGCFLGCFGRRKNHRRRQRRRESFQPRLNRISEGSTKDVHLNLKVPVVEEAPKSASDDDGLILKKKVPTVVEVPKVSEGSGKDEEEAAKISVIPITEICDKDEESHSPSPTRKRVTFDSNVKTYEHVVVEEESIELLDEKEEEVKVRPLKLRQARCSSEGSDVTSADSSGSYPSNHRYQNCRESDDDEEEEDVTDCEESDLEDDEDDYCGVLLHEDFYNDDEIYEDKLRSWDDEVYTEEIADNELDVERVGEKTRRGCDASARDRSGYVNAVLNPIENLSQWKAVKSKGRTTTTQTQPRKKENASLVSDQEHKLNASFSLEEPHFSVKPKSRDETKKHRTQQVAVDASLSTWLSTSQTTTSGCSSSISTGVETATSEKKKYYSKRVQSHDERPILCALTSEEIKQFSATNSPRKSPSKSPESPIIGTVGGYWNSHSMATSKYREL